MKTKDLAYVAGFLDADGWMTMARCNKTAKRPSFMFSVGIVNKNLEVLQWIQSLFGGRIRARKFNQKSPHAVRWSQTYDWNADASCVQPFLRAILPHLRVKKSRALLMLEYLETRRTSRNGGYAEFRTDSITYARREQIYREVRKLNHAGTAPLTIH